MNGMQNISTRMALVLAAICTLTTSTTKTLGAGHDRDRSRGTVDGSAFAKLAGSDDMLIEVTLSSAMLKMAAGAVGQEIKGAQQLLDGIDSISAVVVGVKNEKDRAAKLIEELGEDLSDRGWDRMARIREEGMRASVFILPGKGEVVDGITVVVTEKSEDTLVFANISGKIDLSLMAEIGMNLDIPGLEHLTSNAFKSEVKKHRRKSKE